MNQPTNQTNRTNGTILVVGGAGYIGFHMVRQIQVFGSDYPTSDGTCIRDYVHVNDLARAHLLALDALLNGGYSDIYNLGSSRGCSVREVIRRAEMVTGRPISVVEAPRRGSRHAGGQLRKNPAETRGATPIR